MTTRLVSLRPANSVRGRVGRWILCLGLIHFGAILTPAQGSRPDQTPVHFDGALIPPPPQQGSAWEAPPTKLPRFLVNATADLFNAGMADPRRCDYRAVEIGDDASVATHGFVFHDPARPDKRFVVGWNGITYPALSVGEPADLAADILKLANQLTVDRAKNGDGPGGLSKFRSSRSRLFGPFGGLILRSASAAHFSMSQICLLLRLGRVDLAETLFAAATPWTTQGTQSSLTNYGLSLVTLAQDYLHELYFHAVDAFGRADDVVALDAARRVAAFVDRVEPRLDALGFPAVPADQRQQEAPPHFANLRQYRSLLADLERRALEPPRGPIPGPAAPAAERVAVLVRDLDQITGGGVIMNGVTSVTGSSIEKNLIREGDAAVEPLLQVLEFDQRLTRTISNPGSRGGLNDRSISKVYPVAASALREIFQTRVIPGSNGYYVRDNPTDRRREAATLRAFWAKNKDVPELERYYRRLNDPQATQAEWTEAAEKLAQPASYQNRTGPRKGEPLRSRTDPSVTDLIARRVEAINQSDTAGSPRVATANQLAATLATWDPTSALPTLKAQVRQTTRIVQATPPNQNKPERLEADIAMMTLLRQTMSDPEALADYAVWARAATPTGYNFFPAAIFEPLWLYPDAPALAGVAEGLFADPGSPWVPLYRPGVRPTIGDSSQPGLVVTPLLGLEPFRNLVLAGLDDLAPFSTVETDTDGKIKVNLGESSYQTPDPRPDSPLRPRPGSKLTLRRADFYAEKLGTLDGFPGIDLWWPLADRDAAIATCRATLRQYGPRLRADIPESIRSSPSPFEHGRTTASFKFARLDHPATPEDVAAGRAIFHLDGDEVRQVPMPGFPLAARWSTLEVADDDPFQPVTLNPDSQPAQVQYRLDRLRAGKVWQAEEVRIGERRHRIYGFVGHHGLFRVPAEEVEFVPPEQIGWSPSTADYATRITFDPEQAVRNGGGGSVRPGESVESEFWIWNSRGFSLAAPTDWFRGGPQPSIAHGVTIRLFRRSARFPTVPPDKDQETETPIRPVRHHDAGSGPLDPATSRSLGRLNFSDLFAIDEPGYYRISFQAEGWHASPGKSGQGGGDFQIANPTAAAR